MLSYEEHLSGGATSPGTAAARFANRFRGRPAVREEEDEFEGMDLEEIAALGLAEGACNRARCCRTCG